MLNTILIKRPMKRTITLIVMLCIIGMANIANAQEVKINTNLAVEADGTVRMDDGAMVWDDLRITLDKGSSSASLQTVPGLGGPQIWYFKDQSGVDAMSFTVQLPHSWKEGTRIYPHLHWTPNASETGNVIWNFEYSWVNYSSTTPEAFPAVTTIPVTSTGPFVVNTHLIASLTANNEGLDGVGKKISSILVCRIWRDSSGVGDTYTNDAGLLFLDFHYQLDTFGSRETFAK